MQDNRPAQNGNESIHNVDDAATLPTCQDSGGECTPTAVENRETERSNRVLTLMGVDTMSRCQPMRLVERLSKKRMLLGKPGDMQT